MLFAIGGGGMLRFSYIPLLLRGLKIAGGGAIGGRVHWLRPLGVIGEPIGSVWGYVMSVLGLSDCEQLLAVSGMRG